MNSISSPSSASYQSLSFAGLSKKKDFSSLHFGSINPLNEAKREAGSMLSDMIVEVKRYFSEFVQGVTGKFQTAFIGGKNAFKVFSQGLSIGDTLHTASPESTFESRVRTLGTLAYAEFYDTLLQIEENPSKESKELLFLLYDSVLQEFPALLKTLEFPKLRETPFLLYFFAAHPAPDETKETLFQIITDPENQEKLSKLNPRQIKEVTEALSEGNPEQLQEKIDTKAEAVVVKAETAKNEASDLEVQDSGTNENK